MGRHSRRPDAAGLRTGRAGVHRRCGESTHLDGGHFREVAHPLSDMRQMLCVHCGEAFPLAEFAWEDTGEPLPEYHSRHSARASPLARLLAGRGGELSLRAAASLAGLLPGGAAGLASGPGLGFAPAAVLGVLGAAVGFCVQAFALGPLLLRSICGESDPRRLT